MIILVQKNINIKCMKKLRFIFNLKELEVNMNLFGFRKKKVGEKPRSDSSLKTGLTLERAVF